MVTGDVGSATVFSALGWPVEAPTWLGWPVEVLVVVLGVPELLQLAATETASTAIRRQSARRVLRFVIEPPFAEIERSPTRRSKSIALR